MLAGHLDHPETYHAFLAQPPWLAALEWLAANAHQPDGEYPIQSRDMFAIVQTVTTLPRAKGIFEAHRQYIDLQYCISGGELIEWAPLNTLTPQGEFLDDKDYGHYLAPASATSLTMTPGTFGIFFPHDAHMPKISDGRNPTTKKVVVKIRTSLLTN